MRKKSNNFCIKKYLDKKSDKYPQHLRDELLVNDTIKESRKIPYYSPINEDIVYKARDY